MDNNALAIVVKAINVILDPTSSSEDRKAAHSICEECKSNKMCSMIGYTLASNKCLEPQIKHFGLQLMQYFIHNNWVEAAEEIQLQMKHNVMSLIENCDKEESCYVKDGISHVLTEIAKHIWPQKWPSMVQDLIKKAGFGPVQTELVELVFLRLAEDVAVLQNISVDHRSKDIRQGLSLSMGQIMDFFCTILEENSVKYARLQGSTNSAEMTECKVHHDLVCSTLKSLHGFMEWINIDHIFMNKGAFLQILFRLLSVEGVQVLAAECLLLIVSRKGKAEEREQLLNLTAIGYINMMAVAVQNSVKRAESEEEQYLFMKRMGGVFSALAGQIVSAWADKDSVDSLGCITGLSTHTVFLDVLLAFLQHENPAISFTVSTSWNNFLRHREIRKDEILIKRVPALFETASLRIRKDGKLHIPSHALLDFNDDEEMEELLKCYRSTLVQIVRWCTRCQPIHCIKTAFDWLSMELTLPVDAGCNDQGVKLDQCSVMSPTYIKWEALKTILDMVLSSVLISVQETDEEGLLPIETAKKLLGNMLSCELNDVLLCQCLLSSISAFLPLTKMMACNDALILSVIEKYVKVLKFTKSSTGRYNENVRSLRRHALSGLIHLCKYHTALVLKVYNDFKNAMTSLLGNSGELTLQEQVCIFEALVLVSGGWNDFFAQSNLISEIMTLSTDMWPSKADNCFNSPCAFASAIGLCVSETECDSAVYHTFRRNVSFCISLTLGVIYRSNVPEEMGVAEKGGFLDSNGNVRHPCGKQVCAVLEHIVLFVRLFHGLWTKPVQEMVHADLLKSLDIRECERRSLILYNSQTAESSDTTEKPLWEKMQNFILLNLENCYQILGNIGKCNIDLYSSPGLISSVISKIFCDLQTLPGLRMRAFIRQFLFYFLKHCPQQCYSTVVVPVLLNYCSFMNDMLQAKWGEYENEEQARLNIQNVALCEQLPNDGDAKETDEIVREQLLRTISREYLEMMVNLCVIKTPRNKNGAGAARAEENQQREAECEMQDVSVATSTPNTSQLTPLAIALMEGVMAETLLVTGLASLAWHDTMTVFKGIQLLWPVLKHTFSEAPHVSDDAAKYLFESALRGLRRNGQHDGCQAQLLALSLFIYVNLRPSHESLLEILRTVPKVSCKLITDFDTQFQGYSEKKRRITFKKVVGGIIEQHVGQLFKSQQIMQRLPSIFSSRRKKLKEPDPVCLSFLFFQAETK